MPIFETPTSRQYSDDFFFGRFAVLAGVSVVKVGAHYTQMPYPWMGDLHGQDGVDYFLGGHIYTVTQGIADALESDGFTTIPDDNPPPPPPPPPPPTEFGWGAGPFGSGPFGGSS